LETLGEPTATKKGFQRRSPSGNRTQGAIPNSLLCLPTEPYLTSVLMIIECNLMLENAGETGELVAFSLEPSDQKGSQ
jgi:hypothetical protein